LLSLTREMRFGSAPPSPRPVSARAQDSERMSQARAVSSENSPNSTMEPMTTRLRPIASDSRPPTSAPMNRPTVLALKKSPSCPELGLNSGPMPPTATPAACRSMPSQKTASTQQMMVKAAAPRRSPCADRMGSGRILFQFHVGNGAAARRQPLAFHRAIHRHGLRAVGNQRIDGPRHVIGADHAKVHAGRLPAVLAGAFTVRLKLARRVGRQGDRAVLGLLGAGVEAA